MIEKQQKQHFFHNKNNKKQRKILDNLVYKEYNLLRNKIKHLRLSFAVYIAEGQQQNQIALGGK